MGEVYRADDLKLGQPVALKFLPEVLQADADRRERFYNEVRMARQVTHRLRRSGNRWISREKRSLIRVQISCSTAAWKAVSIAAWRRIRSS